MLISSRQLLIENYKKQGNKYPVKVRICYQRITKDFKTGLSLTKEEYQQANVVSPKKNYREIKAKLDALTSQMNNAINSIEIFTFEKFKNAFYGGVKSKKDVYAVFDEFIELKAQNGAYKTKVSYETAKASLKQFKTHLSFYDIDVSFLNRYQNWMRSTVKASDTTIGIYCRAIRAVINYAMSKGYIKNDFEYPFGKYKYQIPAGRNIKKALPALAVRSLFEYDLLPNSLEQRARDFWIFSYLCNGMNMNDIVRLRWSNIDGQMLRFYRGKTARTTQSNKRLISIAISPEIASIISQWGITGRDDDFIFPFIKKDDDDKIIVHKKELLSKSLNKYLKRICKDLKLAEFKITMIHARHTAATTMKRNNISNEKISEALGHSDLQTTKNYLADFDDISKNDITKSLLSFRNA